MRKILFTADDWGLSSSIHDSIVRLHGMKAIEAAGIMVGQKFTDQAVAYASKHGDLETGLHLFASDRDCTPLSRGKWPFFWPEDMWINSTIGLPTVKRLVLEEVEAQFEAWKHTGLPLKFVSSHFHFHAHRAIAYPFLDLLLKHFPDFHGWVRLGDSRTMPGTAMDAVGPVVDLMESAIYLRDWKGLNNDTLWGIDRVFSNRAEDVIDAAAHLGDGFHEFFFHPGRGKGLADDGTDAGALTQLADLLPRSKRGIA